MMKRSMHTLCAAAVLASCAYAVAGGAPAVEAGASPERLVVVGTASARSMPIRSSSVCVYESHDDGATWREASDMGTGEVVTSIKADAKGRLWMPSHTGRLFRSDDGGATWRNTFNASMTGQCQMLYDMGWNGAGSGFIVCDAGTSGYRSTDGGASWQPFSFGTQHSGSDYVDFVSFINATHGVAAVSIGAVYYTTVDGGAAWTRHVYVPPSNYTASSFSSSAGFFSAPGDATAPLALLAGSLTSGSGGQVRAQFAVEAFGRLPVFVSPPGHTDITGSVVTRGRAVLGAPPFLLDGGDHAAFTDGKGAYVTVGGSEVGGQVNGVQLSGQHMFIVGFSKVYRAAWPTPGDPAPKVAWSAVLDAGDCELYTMVPVPMTAAR